MRMLRFLFWAMLAACPTAAFAQVVVPIFVPNPAQPGQNVRLYAELPFFYECGLAATESIERVGNAITVRYSMGFSAVCGPAPPGPIVLVVDLGGFPSGTYTVNAIGTNGIEPQAPVPIVNGTFQVIAASVPASGTTSSVLLLALVVALGLVAIARRRRVS